MRELNSDSGDASCSAESTNGISSSISDKVNPDEELCPLPPDRNSFQRQLSQFNEEIAILTQQVFFFKF